MKSSMRDKFVVGGWYPINTRPILLRVALLLLTIWSSFVMGILACVYFFDAGADSLLEAAIEKNDILQERSDQIHRDNVEHLQTLDALEEDVDRYTGGPWTSSPPEHPGLYQVLPPSQYVEVFIKDSELWFLEPCGVGPEGVCLKHVAEAHEKLRWGTFSEGI